MKYGLTSLLLAIFLLLGASKVFGGLGGWLIIGVLAVSLIGLISYLSVSGMFMSPKILLDDVRDAATRTRDKLTSPVNRNEDDA